MWVTLVGSELLVPGFWFVEQYSTENLGSRDLASGRLAPRGLIKGATMQLGIIGLGRMGANMVRRLMRGGHQCVVFDLSPANVSGLVAEGATGASSMED